MRPGIDRKRYVAPALVYDPDAAAASKAEREKTKPKRRQSGYCPTMFHMHDSLTGNELSSVNRQARDLEVTSDSLLNLIVLLHRRGDRNSLVSLLDFLEQLR